MKKVLWLGLLWSLVVGCATSPMEREAPQIDFDRPHMEFKLVYNFDVYQKPSIFSPKSFPTYVIWLEDKSSGNIHPIFITGKAGKNTWIFAESRPESVPVWYGVKQEFKGDLNVDAVSGATPAGEAAVILWQVPQTLINKNVDVYIEANNSYDYNEYYTKVKDTPGYSGANGQPSLIWKATLDLSEKTNEAISPEIIGHGQVQGLNHQIDPDVSKITTANETFQYIGIRYIVHP
jgi:hypothetical protein